MPKGVERNKKTVKEVDYSEYRGADVRRARCSAKRRTITIVAICILVFVAAVLLFLSPVFAIEKYEIEDMQYYEADEIIEVLKEVEGKNGIISVMKNTSFDDADRLFSFGLPDLEKKLIFNCPYIESAEISFAFPNKIKVKAVERKPSFLTEFHNTYLYVDSKGVVIETFTKSECPNYPIIKGLEIEKYKIGCSITENDSKKIKTSMRLCNLLSEQGILENNIDIIDISDYNDIWMFSAPSLSVKFGGVDDLETKVMLLKAIFNEGFDGNSNGEIDLTSIKDPVFRPNIIESDEKTETENNSDATGENNSADTDDNVSEDGSDSREDVDG